ncbi:MAG: hypothetical protein ACYCV7_13465 [Acidimicrobiales bacterium]
MLGTRVPGIPTLVVGAVVAVVATVGLAIQAVNGTQTVNSQLNALPVHNATIDDAYYRCLDTQARSLVSPDQAVVLDMTSLRDFVTLIKAVGSWTRFANSPSHAVARLSLRSSTTNGGCLGTVVVAHFTTPHHGVTVEIGSGASMAGHGPPPAPPL